MGGNAIGAHDDSARWKPDHLKDHLTLGEVARFVKRDRSRILQLEREGILAAPIRVKVGRLSVRLYSAAEAAKIKQHFENVKPGPRR